MTKKGVPDKIPWSQEEQIQIAFDKLKFLLCQAVDTPLSIIDVHRPFKLFEDASFDAVAGTLAQQDDEGFDRPVAYASVKFSHSQHCWATINC